MKISVRLKPTTLMLALSLGLAVPATTSIAAGSDWMNDYFNSAGAAMNVTPSAVYESQGQTTMALGGFSYRGRSVPPISSVSPRQATKRAVAGSTPGSEPMASSTWMRS